MRLLLDDKRVEAGLLGGLGVVAAPWARRRLPASALARGPRQVSVSSHSGIPRDLRVNMTINCCFRANAGLYVGQFNAHREHTRPVSLGNHLRWNICQVSN